MYLCSTSDSTEDDIHYASVILTVFEYTHTHTQRQREREREREILPQGVESGGFEGP